MSLCDYRVPGTAVFSLVKDKEHAAQAVAEQCSSDKTCPSPAFRRFLAFIFLMVHCAFSLLLFLSAAVYSSRYLSDLLPSMGTAAECSRMSCRGNVQLTVN